MRLGHYLLEKKQTGLGITFVDLDETLFNTFAKINVLKGKKVVKSLSNAEYNNYTPEEGETFDFEEFRSSKIFYDTSIPIAPMIKRITRVIRHTEPKGSKVIILTARKDLDDRDLFLEKFRKEGFPIDKAYVERAGNKKGSAPIPAIKKNIILDYISNGLYRRVRIFDDYLSTCKEFLTLQNDIPNNVLEKIRAKYDLTDTPNNELITFTSYHVQEDGSVKEIK
jgi:hypothetical protein